MEVSIAERIRERRKELGLNQKELAESSELSQMQISRYESGDTQPTARTIIALARALHTTTDWLLGYTDYLPEATLTDEELEILRVLRSKSPARYQDILEIVRRV